MMSLEALLPSEIARLVYGYLMNEKCSKTAQLFLNESANLHECRSVLSQGKSFTTRVNGFALEDVLENFCAVNCIVQDKVNQLGNLDDLKHCYDLVDQIRFLLEDCRTQKDVIKVDASTQITPINSKTSPGKSANGCSCFNNDTKRSIQRFDKNVQTETVIVHEPNVVEATLLKDLPGYINSSKNRKCQTERSNISGKSEDSKKADSYNINLHEIQNKEIIHKSSEEYANLAIQTSTIERCDRFDKNVMTDTAELHGYKHIEVQTYEIGSPDSGIPSSVELLGDITSELLVRSEIQERIAENINKVLETKKSIYFSNVSAEGTKEVSSKSFIAEFNKTIQTVSNKTENDPNVLDLINEIIQPLDEIISTEDEVDMEVDNSVDEFQENMDLDSEKATSELNNQDAILVEHEESQTKLLKEQIISNATPNTATKNNQIQVERDPTHSTKCTDPSIVEKISVNEEIFEVPKYTQNNLEKIESNSLNSANSQELQQKAIPTSDNFFTHNNTITSTPLKTFTPVQGFDTCDWFSNEAFLMPDYNKDPFLKTNQYADAETVATTTSLISPITYKDTSSVVEKLNLTNCFTANTSKNKVLNTPDVIYPPKNNFLNFENQKSPGIKNNLHDLHSAQKSNGIVDNSSCLSNEKLFSSESIMLYGMENNVTALPMPVTIPEIEIEDSMTITGTGLSPFLKINKTSKNAEPKESAPITTLNISNEAINNPTAISKQNQNPTEIIPVISTNITEVVIKSTPNTLKENRPKSNRISLSTPKKPSSHVRALNFETPVPRSQSESKANEKVSGRSHESILKELKNSCKSSLFQSPEITNVEIIEQNDYSSENGGNDNLKNLKNEKIAVDNKIDKQMITQTTSVSSQSNNVKEQPIRKKSWDEDLRNMCGEPLETEKESSKKSKKKKKSIDNEKNKDKSDSKKSKKKDKSTPKKLKKKDESTPNKLNKNEKKSSKKSKKNDKKTPKKSKKSNEKEQSPDKTKIDVKNAEEILTVPNILEDTPIDSNHSEKLLTVSNTSKEKFATENSSEKITTSNEISKTMIDAKFSNSVSNLEALLSSSINEDDALNVTDVMKLAAEEISNLNKLNHNESICNLVGNTNDDIVAKMHLDEELMAATFEAPSNTKDTYSNSFLEKEIEIVDSKKIQAQNVKNFGDYKKLDNQLNAEELNDTPSFSNTSLITTPSIGNGQKVEVVYDKVSKIERGRLVQKKYARLQTLDTKIASKSEVNSFTMEATAPHKDEDTSSRIIPPTPRVLSPGNSSSFLMMPMSKLGDESQMRSIRSYVSTPVDRPRTPEIVLTPPKTQNENAAKVVKDIQNNEVSPYFQSEYTTFETLRKSEITQFEVIKENLKDAMPKTRARSNKKINDALKNQIISKNTSNGDLDKMEAVPRHQHRTVSSSSCSSASCSWCSSPTTSASETYANNNNDIENNCENAANGSDAALSSVPINIQESKVRIATSPAKVFSIQKTDQELAKTIKETPAKDENSCSEMKIVDTPNISKPVENPTNLNAKISQMMDMKDKAKSQETDRPKPKIKSVQHILPPIVRGKAIGKALPLNVQGQTHEVQNEILDSNLLFQRITIEKSEEEVTQAVESITVNSDFKFNKSLEKNTESATPSPVSKPNDLNNTPNKLELIKAVQSIASEIDSPVYSPVKKCDVNDEKEQLNSNETNSSKFEYNSDHSQDSVASQSEQKASVNSTNWIDLNAANKEFYFQYDNGNGRKRRRKKIHETELETKYYLLNSDDELDCYTLKPSSYECLYEQRLPRARKAYKKKESKAKSEHVSVKENSQESSSTTSSVFSSLSHNQKDEEKLTTKRKRSDDLIREAMNNKRLKNLDFEEF